MWEDKKTFEWADKWVSGGKQEAYVEDMINEDWFSCVVCFADGMMIEEWMIER